MGFLMLSVFGWANTHSDSQASSNRPFFACFLTVELILSCMLLCISHHDMKKAEDFSSAAWPFVRLCLRIILSALCRPGTYFKAKGEHITDHVDHIVIFQSVMDKLNFSKCHVISFWHSYLHARFNGPHPFHFVHPLLIYWLSPI